MAYEMRISDCVQTCALPISFALFDDGIGPAEVGVGGRHVVQALVVTSEVIMLDEGFDLGLKVTGQEVIFEQDAIIEGLMPALDLAMGLGIEDQRAIRSEGSRVGKEGVSTCSTRWEPY